MKRPFLTLLGWLLLLDLALGEAVAVITGPTESKAGAMFVLDAKESTGDVHQWIVPDMVGDNCITCGSRFATAISTPGTYEFLLIIADKEPSIGYARHMVTITGDEKPVPDPVPDTPSFREVRQASHDTAVETRDLRTAKHMIASLDIAVPKLADMTKAEAQKSVGFVIEGVLLARKGASRDAPWISWRKAVDAAIRLSNPKTTQEYISSVKAVTDGLMDAESALASAENVLHYYTSETCTICVKWERNVKPTLERRGIKVVTYKRGHNEPLVPVFVYGGNRHVGYMSIAEFDALVGS